MRWLAVSALPLLVVILSLTWSGSHLFWSIAQSPTALNVFNALQRLVLPVFNAQRATTRLREDNTPRKEFDFIIVGAGPAGSALAYRLSEDSLWDVLILEAGGEEVSIMTIPYFVGQFYNSDANWQYSTTKQNTTCIGLIDSKCEYPQGRALGGGTTINYMFNIRGNRRDFDNWAEMGNDGWSYMDVLPYFRKVEDVRIPEIQNSGDRGYGGRVKTTYPSYISEMGKLLLRGAREAGFDTPLDYNSGPQTGFSRIQTTTFRGERWSANRGYLRQARARANVFLRPRSFVTHVLFDGTRARGVRYVRDGRTHEAFATKEIILSAGAVNTPALLMRSGIGPKEHLEEMGIPLLKDLPVGMNLMEHTATFAPYYVINQTVAPNIAEVLLEPRNSVQYFAAHEGPFTAIGPFEVVSFHDLEETPYHTPGWPDIEILYSSTSPAISEEIAVDSMRYKRSRYLQSLVKSGPAFLGVIFRLRPKSRGRVFLKNKDPFTSPNIDPNSFAEQEDIEVVLAGIREFQKITKTSTLQHLGARLIDTPVPECEDFLIDSDDYWRCAIRQLSMTIYHPCGTCKMAPTSDPTGVVTPDLKLIGFENIRVVDSSVMPLIVSGHLQITSYMIGEKTADVILKQYMR